MKIIWILDNINSLNGMVQVVIGLSNHFSEKGHNVRIYSFFSENCSTFFHINPEISVENLNLEWSKTSRADKHILLGRIMKNSDADIMLTCNEWAHTAAILNRINFKGKLILTQHLSCDKFSRKRKLVNSLLHRFADAVVVLTKFDKAFYEKTGIQNVTVIPNAVYISPQGGDKTNILCSVGRVETVKGFDMLISAFSQIAKDFPDWKLQIWGDGSQRESLLTEVCKLGLSNQIELPGVTNQVAEVLSQSSIFVMSSRWEGSPLALIEAMASGNAIVAFDLPFTKDLLSTDFALIVPNGDVYALAQALRIAMTNKKLREEFGEGARTASEKFSIENIGKMWLKLFSNLCK